MVDIFSIAERVKYLANLKLPELRIHADFEVMEKPASLMNRGELLEEILLNEFSEELVQAGTTLLEEIDE